MKKLIAITLAACICASSAFAAEEAKKETARDWLDAMAYNFGRGCVNCLTFWLEVPRNCMFESMRNPYYGYIPGLVDGGFLGVARAFGGVTDVVRFGLTGPGIYSDSFPEYVWQSKWIPSDALVLQELEKK